MAQERQTSLSQVKGILSMDNVKMRFNEVLGKKAAQFMTSIVNVVSASDQLKKCNPNSIIAAALVAATYDLPIDSNLGFSAIVPYNNSKYNPSTRQYEKHMEAQFQMMYKGFIQLAIRSGYYEKMNYAVVYEDELLSYNPITGEVEFVEDFSECTQRNSGDESKVAGYYAWFRLKTGFRHDLFMTKKEMDLHAKKYSQSYRTDLNKNKKSSKWTTDFESMALKTVIKLLLSKWGILSIDMQRAITDDQKVYDEDGSGGYKDNSDDVIDEKPVDVFAIDSEEEKPAQLEGKAHQNNSTKTNEVRKQEPVRAQQDEEEFAQFEQEYSQQSMDDFMNGMDGSELPFR